MSLVHYQLAWNSVTRAAVIQSKGDLLPAGSINAGFFDHDSAAADTGTEVATTVWYRYVQDVLYRIGRTDMQTIAITVDTDYIALASFVIAPATVTLAAAATQQLTVTPTPSNASNTTVTWVSATPAKATVSASGLVTAVASGTSVITATSQDGALTATRTITVS